MAALIEFAYLCDAIYGKNGEYAPASVSVGLKKASVIWQRQGVVFKRSSDNSVIAALYARADSYPVLVYRGTDNMGDFEEDSYIATGTMPPSAMDAIGAVSKVNKSSLYLTGHSLGGALAIIGAGRFGLPAVTFNAPGVGNQCLQVAYMDRRQPPLLEAMQRCIGGARLRNIRIQGDAVSASDTERLSKSYQAGKQESYPPPASCTTTRSFSNYVNPAMAFLSPTNALAKAVVSESVDLAKDTYCRHRMTTCIQVVLGLPDAYNEVKL